MSLMRHTAWAVAAAITLAVSRFAVIAIIARRTTTETFGQFAFGQWLVDLAFLVCSLGATGLIARYLAEYRHDRSISSAIVRRWLPYAIALPCLAGVGAVFGAWVSDFAMDSFGLGMLALWAVGNGAWAMQTAALNGMQRFDLIFLANLVAGCVMIVGAALVPIGAGAGYLFALMAASALVGATIGARQTAGMARAAPGTIKALQWRSVRLYAFNVWLTALLWNLVWSRGELPIVRAQLGDVGVAHYAAALTLFGGAIQGVMLAVSGAAPQLTRLWGQGAPSAATSLARTLMDVQVLAAGAAALVLIGLGPELMHLAFGDAYRQEAGVLAILGVGLLAMAVSCQSHLLQLATDARFTRDTTLIGLVALLGAATVLVGVWGIAGAAAARAGAMLLMAGATLVATRKRWGRTAFSGRNVAIAFAVVVVSAGAAAWLGEQYPFGRIGASAVAFVALCVTIREPNGRAVAAAALARIWQHRAGGARSDSNTRRS